MRRKIPDLAQALTGTSIRSTRSWKVNAAAAGAGRAMAAWRLNAVIVEALAVAAPDRAAATIPGVGETVAQVIVAETGADMTRFPTSLIWLPGRGWRRRCA